MAWKNSNLVEVNMKLFFFITKKKKKRFKIAKCSYLLQKIVIHFAL